MKAPIKMLFPTVLFIFPAMFLVILGPRVPEPVEGLLTPRTRGRARLKRLSEGAVGALTASGPRP